MSASAVGSSGVTARRRGMVARASARNLVVAVGVGAVGLALAVPGGASATTAGHHAPTVQRAQVGTHYAVDRPLCAAPKPGYSSCFAIRRVPASRTTPGAQPYVVHASYPVGPSGGLTPKDLTKAYGVDADGGAGQIVAIVDAYNDPNILSDLDTFDAQYGLPAETPETFGVVGQDGSPTDLPADDTQGWSGEESLDVETARGVCHLCTIVLVEANSPSNTNLAAGVKSASKFGATEISNSYGGPEGNPKQVSKSQRKAEKKAYNFPGIVVTASTGDDGWFTWDKAKEGIPSAESPNLPSSLPTVVSVGGTLLNLKSNGKRHSETVWNENGPGATSGFSGATGGGCSVLYKAQGWQKHVGGYKKTGCGKQRLAADVSADADPNSGIDVYDTYHCSGGCPPANWTTIGGTSLSSPLIAAMWALAGGARGEKYPSLSLYGHSKSSSDRYDVKKGGNSWCDGVSDKQCESITASEAGGEKNPNFLALDGVNLGTLDCSFKDGTPKPKTIAHNQQCNAAKGYDGPTGIGTPKSVKFFKPSSLKPTISTKGKVEAKKKATFIAGGKDPFPGGRFTKYHWNFGDGHTSGGHKATHKYKKSGHYTVTLKVTDNYGQTAKVSQKIKVH